MISEAEMQALVGHTFPGGGYEVEHWENFLLTEATGRESMPGDLLHPIHLFHVPIAGVGISIADLFALARADSDASVTIDYYDWEYASPLREGIRYGVRGGVTEHERKLIENGPTIDSLTFRIELAEQSGEFVARATFRWHFWRFEA
jgi:hypothetical protein